MKAYTSEQIKQLFYAYLKDDNVRFGRKPKLYKDDKVTYGKLVAMLTIEDSKTEP